MQHKSHQYQNYDAAGCWFDNYGPYLGTDEAEEGSEFTSIFSSAVVGDDDRLL
jgi:hypothetical protein